MLIISNIKSVYHLVIPEKIRFYIWKIRYFIVSNIVFMIKKILPSYKIVSLGNLNRGKIFYLINFAGDGWGALSTWAHVMLHVSFARRKGYVPYVDLKNVTNAVLLCDKEDMGKVNCWDLYFKQPQYDYSLDDIMHSRKVIVVKSPPVIPEYARYRNIRTLDLPLNRDDFLWWRSRYLICPFSDAIISYAEELKRKLFPKGEKILAVSYRREFEWQHYHQSTLTPPGTHLIRGGLFDVFSQIKRLLKNYSYKYFFFFVDDREALVSAKKEFGSSCIYLERPLRHFFSSGKIIPMTDLMSVNVEIGLREHDVCLTAKEYLASIYLMSKCNSFLSAGGTSDLLAYLINNNQFENFFQIEGKGDANHHVGEGK